MNNPTHNELLYNAVKISYQKNIDREKLKEQIINTLLTDNNIDIYKINFTNKFTDGNLNNKIKIFIQNKNTTLNDVKIKIIEINNSSNKIREYSTTDVLYLLKQLRHRCVDGSDIKFHELYEEKNEEENEEENEKEEKDKLDQEDSKEEKEDGKELFINLTFIKAREDYKKCLNYINYCKGSSKSSNDIIIHKFINENWSTKIQTYRDENSNKCSKIDEIMNIDDTNLKGLFKKFNDESGSKLTDERSLLNLLSYKSYRFDNPAIGSKTELSEMFIYFVYYLFYSYKISDKNKELKNLYAGKIFEILNPLYNKYNTYNQNVESCLKDALTTCDIWSGSKKIYESVNGNSVNGNSVNLYIIFELFIRFYISFVVRFGNDDVSKIYYNLYNILSYILVNKLEYINTFEFNNIKNRSDMYSLLKLKFGLSKLLYPTEKYYATKYEILTKSYYTYEDLEDLQTDFDIQHASSAANFSKNIKELNDEMFNNLEQVVKYIDSFVNNIDCKNNISMCEFIQDNLTNHLLSFKLKLTNSNLNIFDDRLVKFIEFINILEKNNFSNFKKKIEQKGGNPSVVSLFFENPVIKLHSFSQSMKNNMRMFVEMITNFENNNPNICLGGGSANIDNKLNLFNNFIKNVPSDQLKSFGSMKVNNKSKKILENTSRLNNKSKNIDIKLEVNEINNNFKKLTNNLSELTNKAKIYEKREEIDKYKRTVLDRITDSGRTELYSLVSDKFEQTELQHEKQTEIKKIFEIKDLDERNRILKNMGYTQLDNESNDVFKERIKKSYTNGVIDWKGLYIRWADNLSIKKIFNDKIDDKATDYFRKYKKYVYKLYLPCRYNNIIILLDVFKLFLTGYENNEKVSDIVKKVIETGNFEINSKGIKYNPKAILVLNRDESKTYIDKFSETKKTNNAKKEDIDKLYTYASFSEFQNILTTIIDGLNNLNKNIKLKLSNSESKHFIAERDENITKVNSIVNLFLSKLNEQPNKDIHITNFDEKVTRFKKYSKIRFNILELSIDSKKKDTFFVQNEELFKNTLLNKTDFNKNYNEFNKEINNTAFTKINNEIIDLIRNKLQKKSEKTKQDLIKNINNIIDSLNKLPKNFNSNDTKKYNNYHRDHQSNNHNNNIEHTRKATEFESVDNTFSQSTLEEIKYAFGTSTDWKKIKIENGDNLKSQLLKIENKSKKIKTDYDNLLKSQTGGGLLNRVKAFKKSTKGVTKNKDDKQFKTYFKKGIVDVSKLKSVINRTRKYKSLILIKKEDDGSNLQVCLNIDDNTTIDILQQKIHNYLYTEKPISSNCKVISADNKIDKSFVNKIFEYYNYGNRKFSLFKKTGHKILSNIKKNKFIHFVDHSKVHTLLTQSLLPIKKSVTKLKKQYNPLNKLKSFVGGKHVISRRQIINKNGKVLRRKPKKKVQKCKKKITKKPKSIKLNGKTLKRKSIKNVKVTIIENVIDKARVVKSNNKKPRFVKLHGKTLKRKPKKKEVVKTQKMKVVKLKGKLLKRKPKKKPNAKKKIVKKPKTKVIKLKGKTLKHKSKKKVNKVKDTQIIKLKGKKKVNKVKDTKKTKVIKLKGKTLKHKSKKKVNKVKVEGS
jgi:hypothetical protein